MRGSGAGVARLEAGIDDREKLREGWIPSSSQSADYDRLPSPSSFLHFEMSVKLEESTSDIESKFGDSEEVIGAIYPH